MLRVILSPAKTMKPDLEGTVCGLPPYLDETRELIARIKKLPRSKQQALWRTSDALTTLNRERFAQMDPEDGVTPAITSFRGLAFQEMAPEVISEEGMTYLQAKLRILSGLYGVIRPLHGVVPYRLEMGSPFRTRAFKDLYSFWGRKIYDAVMDDGATTLINLASDEYAAAVLPHMAPTDRVIQVDWGDWVDGRVKRSSTYAKMARGQMVRFMAEGRIEDPEALKTFTGVGFRFEPKLSDAKRWVWLRERHGDLP